MARGASVLGIITLAMVLTAPIGVIPAPWRVASGFHPLPHLRGVVVTDKQVYRPGEPVLITVSVYNYDLVGINISFGGCLATFTVGDKDGRLWYEPQQTCTAVIREITVPAGQTVGLAKFLWGQVDKNGKQVPVPNTYIITGYVLSYEYVPPGVTEIAILSAYEPILGGASFNVSMVVALSQAHPPAGAASTIDVVAAIPVAGSMARAAIEGLPGSLLDIEAAKSDGLNITVVVPCNLMAFGGRGVNWVTKYYNDLPGARGLPVRTVPGRGVCTTDATGDPVHCYRRQVNATTGQVTDYAFAAIVYDAAAGRYVMAIAGLSGYATRAEGQLVALTPSAVLTGTGTIAELVDLQGDGWYESFQVVDGTGGAWIMPSPVPFPHPIGVVETFAVGLSQVHGVVGAANTIDVVGAIPMAVREARLRLGTIWAALDIDVASLDGTAILPAVGNLTALGGRGVNLVTYYYASSPIMPIRLVPDLGLCVTDGNGTILRCYSNRLCSLPCIQLVTTPLYGYRAEGDDRAAGRHVHLVAGLSGFATRNIALLIARDLCTVNSGTGVILVQIDTNGDGVFDRLDIIDGTGDWRPSSCPFPVP